MLKQNFLSNSRVINLRSPAVYFFNREFEHEKFQTILICCSPVTQAGPLLKNDFLITAGRFARNLKMKCAQAMRTLFTSDACFLYNLCAAVFSIVRGTKSVLENFHESTGKLFRLTINIILTVL